LAWRATVKTIADVKHYPDLAWMGELLRMLQIAGIAYVVGGAFLPLSYFDLSWHILAIIVICQDMVRGRENSHERSRVPVRSPTASDDVPGSGVRG